MGSRPKPTSLIAERAVRFLREHPGPARSTVLTRELLETRSPDEQAATRILRAAFVGDPRLIYGRGGWRLAQTPRGEMVEPELEPDRVLILLAGARVARGEPWRLATVSIVRLRGDEVVAACGGDVSGGPPSRHLRRAVSETLAGCVPVLHDPPGARAAFERWLEEPLRSPVSLRRLGEERLGLAARHDLPALAGRLGLRWTEADDPLEQADTLDACLARLRRPGETLHDLQRATARPGSPPIDWSRYEFDLAFLERIPHVPGTYRFIDGDGELIYVGKSSNLHRRINSYFQEGGRPSPRVQRLLGRLRRIEYQHSGSDLEAMLREAEQIRRDTPASNVQRRIHARAGRAARLRSILILVPAEDPHVLRAYLIHDGRLIARVGIGPRGGGLARIERLLDDQFFFMPEGPTPVTGPDLDVEVVVRWLAANRDRAVAFDPTELRSAREVTNRLRWFLGQGSPFDPDGGPVFAR